MPPLTRLAVIGDIHAHQGNLQRVVAFLSRQPLDGVLLVGDLGSHELGRGASHTAERLARYRASVAEVFETVRALKVPVLWVPGNHDLPDLDGEGCVDRGRLSVVGDLRVTGIGGAGPDRFGFPYEWDEDDIHARRLPACDVLLCHAPPARTPLDRLFNGVHVGSEAIRAHAEATHGVLVCGHILEAPAVTRLGDCLCMNVGGLGQPYGAPQVGFIQGTEQIRHVNLDTGREIYLSRRG